MQLKKDMRLVNAGVSLSSSTSSDDTSGKNNIDDEGVVSISDAYDGGNIELIRQEKHDEHHYQVFLNIKPDPYTELEQKEHYQYFSFRSTPKILSNVDGESTSESSIIIEYIIDNAADASYAEAWDESTIFYSNSITDSNSWKRKLDTSYEKDTGHLSWTHVHHFDDGKSSSPSVYFCYFPPYSYARHLHLIDQCNNIKRSIATASLEVYSVGQTIKGCDLDCIQVGTGRTVCWIIHRQHPGEHMAEYYAEGLLTRLLGLETNGDVDGLVRKLLRKYTFYIVPSMNPDGGTAGHLRTNAKGANLNREWCSSPDYDAPTLERSPEVYYVLEKMEQTGCDVFLDIHGDEGLPYNFLAQPCVPNWGPRLEALHGIFLAAYSRTNPDMQEQYAYEPSDYKEGDVLNIANDQIAHRFDCLSVTLEMPFKDCWSNPDPERGWTPARASVLGSSVLEPLAYIRPFLRDKTEFWKDIAKEDAYIKPTSNYK